MRAKTSLRRLLDKFFYRHVNECSKEILVINIIKIDNHVINFWRIFNDILIIFFKNSLALF